MNSDATMEKPVWHIGIIFAVACLLFAALVAFVKFSAPVPAIDADRAAIISQALFQMRTNETALLNHAGWVDRDRGIVRLPISVALQKAESGWRNPAAARADLMARAERAAAPAPKVAPKPSAFE